MTPWFCKLIQAHLLGRIFQVKKTTYPISSWHVNVEGNTTHHCFPHLHCDWGQGLPVHSPHYWQNFYSCSQNLVPAPCNHLIIFIITFFIPYLYVRICSSKKKKKKTPLRFITLPLPIMYEPLRIENIADSSLCLTEPEQRCLVHCWCSVLFHWKQEVLPCSLTTFPWLYTFIKDLRPHWYFTLIFIHLTNVHWVPAWS